MSRSMLAGSVQRVIAPFFKVGNSHGAPCRLQPGGTA